MTDTEAKPSKPKSKGGEAPVPRTLVGFYADTRVKAPRFVQAIGNTGLRSFAPEDEAAALGSIDQTDPARERTLALLWALPKAKTRGVAELFGGWARHVLRADAGAMGAEGAFGDDGGHIAPDRVVEAVAKAARPAIQGKDKAERRLAEARLRLALAWAATREGADPIRLARVAAMATEASAKGGIQASDMLRKRAIQLVAAADLKTLERALGLAALMEAALADARGREAKASLEAAELRRAGERLRFDLEAAQSEAVRLSAELVTARERTAALERQMHDERLSGQGDVRSVRGRAVRFLNGRLHPMLEQAREATELTPPRADVARDILQGLEGEIRGELEWLSGPSE